MNCAHCNDPITESETDASVWTHVGNPPCDEPTPDPRYVNRLVEGIARALFSQASANHLGDIRNSEEILWRALGASDLPREHSMNWSAQPGYVRARLAHNRVAIPDRYQR